MEFNGARLEDEPLDISVVPRTAPPLISLSAEPAGRRSLSELEVWIGRVVQAAVEIVGGDRPLTQAVRWTSAEVYGDLGRRTAHLARVGRYTPGVGRVQRVRPRVSGVMSSSGYENVVDAAVTVRTGRRARAVAARFVLTDGRWVCTVLDFGTTPTQERSVSAPPGLRDTA